MLFLQYCKGSTRERSLQRLPKQHVVVRLVYIFYPAFLGRKAVAKQRAPLLPRRTTTAAKPKVLPWPGKVLAFQDCLAPLL